jgi:hypothetical protein
MRIQISSHKVTGSIEVTFRTPTGAETRHVIFNGVHLWIGNDQKVDCALLTPEEEGFEAVGRIILGKYFDEVINRVRSNLIEAEETVFDLQVDESLLLDHRALINSPGNLATVDNVSPARTSFEVEFSLRSGDGVPVEVVIDGTPEGLRTAVVHLPESPVSERIIEPTQARIVWDPSTSELKVRLTGITAGEGRIWVRVALGESGDLLAVDRARVQTDGSAVSSSIVPHNGELGELYVDVTDSPTETIGTSRFRVRRRAARLEAFAADLEKGGQVDQASAVRAKAQNLRATLGEDSGVISSTQIKQKRSKWWVGIVLVAVLGALLGWLVRGDNASGAPDSQSVASSSTDVANTVTLSPGDSSVVSPNDQTLLVYRPGTTRFFGEGNVNLAAEVENVVDDSVTVRVQLYDQYERSLGESTTSTQQGLMQECESRVGSDTGSGGGAFALQTRVAAFVASTYEDALLLLADTDLSDPDAEYAGAVTMTANIIESCEVRRIIDQDSVVEIARSAFESFTLEIPIGNRSEAYVVLRVINDKGSSSPWTSTDVLKISK